MAYTNIDDPSAYFQTALWTGNGTAGNAVTFDGNSDMQPDFVWSKIRSAAFGHVLKDTSRGGTANNDQHLVSNSDAAESTYSQYRMDFDSDGFTLDGVGDSGFQGSGTSMVSWAWKANGGTTSSNTDGSITSTVQANTDAGFSIVTYTGSGSDGSTVGHGLGAVPAMVIFKCRSDSNTDWRIYHQSISPTNAVSLNSTGAQYGASSVFTSAFSSTQLKLENEAGANGSSKTYVAYCFAEKQGYSKFGKYIGNGSSNGTFVYTGFKPAFVMWKQTNSARNWPIMDSARDPFNEVDQMVWADLSNAESTVTTDDVDFLSNGFKMRGAGATTNESGGTYIYMAFAENPFVTSTGIPTTAR